MLLFLGIVSLVFAAATLRVRKVMPYSNAGYAAVGIGLLVDAFGYHNTIVAFAGLILVFAGALLLLAGSFVRKEIRAFRESLLPK